jgi:hypothetical protein
MLASVTHASQQQKLHLGTAKSWKEVAQTIGYIFLYIGISIVYLHENVCLRKSVQ